MTIYAKLPSERLYKSDYKTVSLVPIFETRPLPKKHLVKSESNLISCGNILKPQQGLLHKNLTYKDDDIVQDFKRQKET
jgi:hypothetical protein